MAENWQTCTQCGVYFVPPEGNESVPVCHSCGKLMPPGRVKDADAEWYYAREKKKIGPVSTSRLKQLLDAGKLAPTDMVLQSGAQKWTVAGDAKALFPRSIVPPTATTDSVPDTYTPDKTGFDSRHDVLSEAQVVPEAANCVQCGMCSYNCPMEIDVRAHAWRGIPIRDSHCLTCSECVNRCPRGVLRFERIPLFVVK